MMDEIGFINQVTNSVFLMKGVYIYLNFQSNWKIIIITITTIFKLYSRCV